MSAISKIQPSAKEWHDGFTTLIAIVNNIVLNPKKLKYRKGQNSLPKRFFEDLPNQWLGAKIYQLPEILLATLVTFCHQTH